MHPRATTARLEARPWSRIAETVTGTSASRDEVKRAAPVIVVVVALAIGASVFAHRLGPSADADIVVALVLVCLGFVAELLPYGDLPREAAGSVAVMPYAAAVIAIPDSRVLAFVAMSQVIVQVWHRRSPTKGAFNVAQYLLSLAVGLIVFRALISATAVLKGSSFASGLVGYFLPTMVASACILVTNKVCLSVILKAVADRPFWSGLMSSLRLVPPLLVVQTLIAFYLAWISVNLGIFGTVGMLLPLLVVRQLTRTTIQLTKVTEELLDLMVAAIEARDPYTSGHSKRVSAAAVMIAKAMRLKPEQVERVQVAALLHDVGKIHEEFARVLAKEGRLTPDEWTIMKRHPVRSAELVGLVSSLKDVVPALRHHHENWDGTGYPDGKRGEDIPLASRIIMFADTLDAITTDRPYRKALDPEEARREFVKFRAKQFDPQICDVVVSPEVWQALYQSVITLRNAKSIDSQLNGTTAVA